MTNPAHEQAWRPSQLELGRQAFRARQTTKSVIIAAVSTVVFAFVVWLTIINTATPAR